MTPALFLELAVVPALNLLPSPMDTADSRAMLLALALQESGLHARRQRGGPAHGFLQFEKAGISGVLMHAASSLKAVALCESLSVSPSVDAVYDAIEYQDVLCAGLGRLLLWTSRLALGGPNEAPLGWRLYLDTWRPGKPRPDEWRSNYSVAWHTVTKGRPTEMKA